MNGIEQFSTATLLVLYGIVMPAAAAALVAIHCFFYERWYKRDYERRTGRNYAQDIKWFLSNRND